MEPASEVLVAKRIIATKVQKFYVIRTICISKANSTTLRSHPSNVAFFGAMRGENGLSYCYLPL